jgi:hypothetical protein
MTHPPPVFALKCVILVCPSPLSRLEVRDTIPDGSGRYDRPRTHMCVSCANDSMGFSNLCWMGFMNVTGVDTSGLEWTGEDIFL